MTATTTADDAGAEPPTPPPKGRWDRAVTALLVGKLAEVSGAMALITALGKQVFDMSGRELDLGLLGLAEFAPAALLVLLTGAVADRHDRRLVSAAAAMGEALAVVAILLYVAGSPTAVGPLFAMTVAFGVARAFVAPASRSLPADLVAPEVLPWLTARWAIVFQVGMMLGPVVAGTLFAVDNVVAFAAAAAMTLVAAVAYACIPKRHAARPADAAVANGTEAEEEARTAPPTMAERFHDALKGLRLIRREPILFGAISLDLFAVLFGGALALLPAIAEERLGVGAVGFGFLRAAPFVGSSAMMLLLALRPIRRHVGRRMLGAVAVFGLGTIVLGATTNYAVAIAAVIVAGAADAVSVFTRVTLVPLVTPAQARGRVLAVENVFIGASNELGAFESGVTGQFLGPGLAVAVGGVATLVVTATWWNRFPALRDVDRFPNHAAQSVENADEPSGHR